MKRLVVFPTDSGVDVTIEVDTLERDRPVVRGAMPEAALERATQTFEAGISKVMPIAAGLITRVSSLAENVGEASIKFGVKFSAEAGAIIASVSSDANVEVTLKWIKPPKT